MAVFTWQLPFGKWLILTFIVIIWTKVCFGARSKELSQNFTIAIVTHSMQQAARVSHRTAYFHLGKLIEVNPTETVFTIPEHKLTEAYITGRFGWYVLYVII